ncbi:MAG: NADH-quinone oxidoreductase subunit J [Phycisphaerales bacterium]
MTPLINQVALYLLLTLGAVGVCLALPRKGANPQPIGALIAATAGGVVILLLGLTGVEHLPNIYFYVFSAIALGSALRVITHPRPVYAALYFILTILASAGLFVLLAAEFLAFALVIVYAGAILITYLFVIMLATQSPSEDRVEVLEEYDAVAREPVAATAAGFVLLAVLTTMLFGGVKSLPGPGPSREEALLARMPGKIESVLRTEGVLKDGEFLDRGSGGAGGSAMNLSAGTIKILNDKGETRVLSRDQWPARLSVRNIEGVGFDLLADHPGAIEIAGVILLMAMLGAVVLARKQVELDEEAKAKHAARLSGGLSGGMSGGDEP